MKNEFLKN